MSTARTNLYIYISFYRNYIFSRRLFSPSPLWAKALKIKYTSMHIYLNYIVTHLQRVNSERLGHIRIEIVLEIVRKRKRKHTIQVAHIASC